MSAIRNATQAFRKVWGMGEEDEYEEEDAETTSRRARYEARPAPAPEPEMTPTETEPEYENVETRTVSRTVYAPTSAARHGRPAPNEDEGTPSRFQTGRNASQSPSNSGGGRGGSQSSRSLRSVAMPLRTREKNIYTLKPKAMDEASLAADYLKTGCAVVINLDEVERMVAVRIIDFMSGVCYGLENQGHAMKLGDFIFLFTPGDFEISSDEVDYGENPDFIFRNVTQKSAEESEAPTADQGAGSGDIAGERRSWER